MKSCLFDSISWFFYIFLSGAAVVESFQSLSGCKRSRTANSHVISTISTSTSISHINHHINILPSRPTKWILLSQHDHSSPTAASDSDDHETTEHQRNDMKNPNRRTFLHSIMTNTAVATSTTWIVGSSTSSIPRANAIEDNNKVEMKTFIDPKGLFIIQVPKRFFAIRRTVKGDLPDETTGKGRRGSSIFTAGDMAKAEVIAIERFPTVVLLEEEGILPSGDLTTFPAIGKSETIAELIASRRDRERQSNDAMRSNVIPGSVKLYDDGKTLEFELSTEINVQKPDLLLEQTGLDRLVRKTLAKATLNSNDGQMMAVFASALSQDWNSEDGVALKVAVDTFMATDQSIIQNTQ